MAKKVKSLEDQVQRQADASAVIAVSAGAPGENHGTTTTAPSTALQDQDSDSMMYRSLTSLTGEDAAGIIGLWPSINSQLLIWFSLTRSQAARGVCHSKKPSPEPEGHPQCGRGAAWRHVAHVGDVAANQAGKTGQRFYPWENPHPLRFILSCG